MVNKCIGQNVIVARQLSEGQSVLLWRCIWRRRIFSRPPHHRVKRIGETTFEICSPLSKKFEHEEKVRIGFSGLGGRSMGGEEIEF